MNAKEPYCPSINNCLLFFWFGERKLTCVEEETELKCSQWYLRLSPSISLAVLSSTARLTLATIHILSLSLRYFFTTVSRTLLSSRIPGASTSTVPASANGKIDCLYHGRNVYLVILPKDLSFLFFSHTARRPGLFFCWMSQHTFRFAAGSSCCDSPALARSSAWAKRMLHWKLWTKEQPRTTTVPSLSVMKFRTCKSFDGDSCSCLRASVP